MVGGVSSIGSSIGAYRSLAGGTLRNGVGQADSGQADTGEATSSDTTSGAASGGAASTLSLSPQAQQQVQKLKQVDASVRQHEAAHQAAGGGHAGAASFTFTRGPDGKNYATAGEVPIDISPENTPSATIAKMEQVKAAALAPSEPSAQDQRVAAQADALSAKAQSELRRQGGSAESGKSGSGQSGSGQIESRNSAGAAEDGSASARANARPTASAQRSGADTASGDGAGAVVTSSSSSSGVASASARGAAAYSNAQGLVGATAAFGAARGASFIV